MLVVTAVSLLVAGCRPNPSMTLIIACSTCRCKSYCFEIAPVVVEVELAAIQEARPTFHLPFFR